MKKTRFALCLLAAPVARATDGDAIQSLTASRDSLTKQLNERIAADAAKEAPLDVVLDLDEALGMAAEAGQPVVTKCYFLATPAGVKVVTATFLGGKGYEWLVGGGRQPSCAVILAGKLIGPLPGETGDEYGARER